jgi:RHS repeat-associated protein
LAFSANGSVSANVASGPQNFGLKVHQEKSIAKPLMRQGKSQISTMAVLGIFIEEDKETGLLYAKARYYDPDTAKFLSEDAWEGDNLIAPSLHRYLYGYQNPTAWVDPTGNAPEDQVTIQENGTPLYSDRNPDLSEQRAASRAAERQASANADVAARQAQSVARDQSVRQDATRHVDQQKAQGAELNSQYNDGLASHNASNQGGQPISKWRVAKNTELLKESQSQIQTETNEQFVSRHLGSGSGQDQLRAQNKAGKQAAKALEAGAEMLQPDPISRVVAAGAVVVVGAKLANKARKAAPNRGASDELKLLNESFKQGCGDRYCTDYAEKLRDASGGSGKIVVFASKGAQWGKRYDFAGPGGKGLKVKTGNGTDVYSHHSVYTDGKYFYDPFVSNKPIPQSDYLKALKGSNSGGVSWRLHDPTSAGSNLKKGGY